MRNMKSARVVCLRPRNLVATWSRVTTVTAEMPVVANGLALLISTEDDICRRGASDVI